MEPLSADTTASRYLVKHNTTQLLENTNVCPFRWTQNRYRCSYCPDSFMDMSALRSHRDDNHSSPCVRTLYKNIKNAGPIRVDISDGKCNSCQSPFDNLNEATAHLAVSHGIKLFENQSSELLPFKLCAGDDNFKCQLCEQEYVTFTKLKDHVSTHYEMCICETCGKAFPSVLLLRVHSKVHLQGRFACSKCDEVFPTAGAREYHKTKVHLAGPRHRCPYCLAKFMHYYERSRHMEEVHGAKVQKYKCSMCPLVFDSSSKRSMHLRSVHLPRQRSHACALCSWSFVSRCDLKQHMVRHVGERKYQCDVCKKAYARRWTLKEHLRIHNNDRRFVCGVCGSAFVQKCTLKQHVKVHHPGEPAPM